MPPQDKKPGTGKKVAIISGIAAACIVVAVVAVALINNLGGGGVKKTLSCHTYFSKFWTGVETDMTYTFAIGDGTIKQITYERDYNLEGLEYSGGTEEEWVSDKIEEDKASCTDGCTFKDEYVKGKSLTETLVLDEQKAVETMGTGISNYSADEIVEKLQSALEDSGVAWECEAK